MLQQTTVGAVIPYYKEWLRIFPDIETLARAPLQKVLRTWQGLGYYQRARNLRDAARLFVREHGGEVPDDWDALRRTPGFGPYTTAAVLSLAYRRPHPVLDANVRRVMMRVLRIHGRADTRRDEEILDLLRRTIPRRSPGDFNQAMMELGALVCRARNPLCPDCPVQSFCGAFEAGEQEVIPRPNERRYRRVTAVVGVVERDGKILIQKRPAAGLLAGLWEFPGGKVKRGESLPEALARELEEELGVSVERSKFLVQVDHSYTRYRVELHAFACNLGGEPDMKAGRRKWVSLTGLRKYPFPSGSAKIIRFLENHRTGNHKTPAPG
jgi:A/G-specific adenine glycosylase